MSGLSGRRAQLVADLEATGVRTYGFAPPKLNGAAYVLEAGDDYVREGDTFDATQLEVGLDLYVLTAGVRVNATTVAQLDRMLEAAVHRLGEWTIASCDRPTVYTIYDHAAYGTRLGLRSQFHLSDERRTVA